MEEKIKGSIALSVRHGTVLTAGSLQGLCPAAPTARTRIQMRCPLVKLFIAALVFVTEERATQLAAVIGSGLD